MPRPTIAVISDATGFGGSELCLATLLSELGGRWHAIAFLGEEADERTREALTKAGVELECVPGLTRAPRVGTLLWLTRRLRKLRPALVHVSLTDQGDGLVPLAAARLARLPTSATLNLVVPGRARWREHVSARALRLPQLLIAVSRSVATYAETMGATAHVVSNGLSAPSFDAAARTALGLSGHALVVGGIGRLDRQKGWDVFCAAAILVRKEFPDVELVVVGDGPERKQLEDLGQQAGVRFVGFREQASSLLPAFDIAVVPSRYEAFGLVALEAMQAGIPLVVSAVGGLPEVVGECALLIPPEQPAALAEAVAALARNPATARSQAERARSRAAERFNPERMATESERLFRNLVGRSTRSGGHLRSDL